MPRGRPRLPDEIKIARGTWQYHRDGNPTQAVIAEGSPQKPPGLTKAAAKVWDYLLADVEKLGVTRKVDSLEFATLCEHRARADRAAKAMAKATFGSEEYRRADKLFATAAEAFDKLAGKFGLTPSDRARLRLEKPRGKHSGVPARDRTA